MIPEVALIADARAREDARRVIEQISLRLEWRIRPVVAHWPEVEIQRLLGRMAWFKYKYEGAGALETTPAKPWSAAVERPPRRQ